MKKITFGENKNIISGRLKCYRIKAGLSQAQLAARMQTLGANMDQQMISKIEHNARIVTDYELACLCRILEVRAEDLFEDFRV